MSVKHDIIKMIFLVRCDTIKILTNPKIMLEHANTRIYNLSSGPHITQFSAVFAKKRKNFE